MGNEWTAKNNAQKEPRRGDFSRGHCTLPFQKTEKYWETLKDVTRIYERCECHEMEKRGANPHTQEFMARYYPGTFECSGSPCVCDKD